MRLAIAFLCLQPFIGGNDGSDRDALTTTSVSLALAHAGKHIQTRTVSFLFPSLSLAAALVD